MCVRFLVIFFIQVRLVKIVCLYRREKLLYKYIDLIVSVFGENSKTSFLGKEREGLQRPIMDLHFTKGRG